MERRCTERYLKVVDEQIGEAPLLAVFGYVQVPLNDRESSPVSL